MAKKTKSTSADIKDKIKQKFTFNAPAARSVQLAGDFTNWQEHPLEMRKNWRGVWQISVEMEPGEHHYRFLVDGEWCDDPECAMRLPNPFGGQNSVRQVA